MNRAILSCWVLLLFLAVAGSSRGAEALRVRIWAGTETSAPAAEPPFLREWMDLLKERGAEPSGTLHFPSHAELTGTDVLIVQASEGLNLAGAERRSLERYCQHGGGLVVLHDAACSLDGTWLKTLIGGGVATGHTNWQAGWVSLWWRKEPHPISDGIANFSFPDEFASQVAVTPPARVLASTVDSSGNEVPQCWVYERGKSRVFVALPGHNVESFKRAHYRGLILRGLAWAGRRPVDSFLRPEELAALRHPQGEPLSPAETAKKLRHAAEFELRLAAAEPLVVAPTAINWDARGRMWVATAPDGSPSDASGRLAANNAIVTLEDSDGDGQMDRQSVFFAGLNFPASFIFQGGGLVVADGPELIALRDENGDGKAEKREILLRRAADAEGGLIWTGLRWGLDGWIYGSAAAGGGKAGVKIVDGTGKERGKIRSGIFRFRPSDGSVEQVAAVSKPVWGCALSWEGERFFSEATGPHLGQVILSERNLALGKLGDAVSHRFIPDHQLVTFAWPEPGSTETPVWSSGGFSAASGGAFYEGGAWAEKYRESMFTCDPLLHLVHEDILTHVDGFTFDSSRRSEEEFIAGADEWFAPVDVEIGPDGAMYLADFAGPGAAAGELVGPARDRFRAAGCVQCQHQRGRIWRVQQRGARVNAVPALSQVGVGELARALEHPSRWVNETARRLLVERQDRSVAPALAELLLSNRLASVRVQALWTLHGLEALTETNLTRALGDVHPSVQINALRVLPERRSPPGREATAAVLKLVADTDQRVRLEALAALHRWPPDKRVVAALHKLFPNVPDAWGRSALLAVARRAPTNFIQAAFASDRTDAYRDLVGPLVEDCLHHQDEAAALWILQRVARSAPVADSLKLRVLAAFNGNLKEYHPAISPPLRQIMQRLAQAEGREMRVTVYPLLNHLAATGGPDGLGPERDALRQKMLVELDEGKVKDDDRNAALSALMKLPGLPAEIYPRIDLLLQRGVSKGVQRHVITEFAKVTNAIAAEILVRAYPKFHAENKPLAFAVLLRRESSALALLDAVAKNRVDLEDLGLAGRERLLNHPDAAVAKEAAATLKAKRAQSPNRGATAISRFARALEQPANVGNGGKLFRKNCAACHKLGGEGSDLGPDLTASGLYEKKTLLSHILDPNRLAEVEFLNYRVATKQGEYYSGLLKSQTGEKLVFKNVEGEVELKRADLLALESSGLSLMPNGYQVLGAKNIRDIIGYMVNKVPKGFRPLDLAAACTVDSRKPLDGGRGEDPFLSFKQFGMVMVQSIPFHIVNPASTVTGRNVVMLQGIGSPPPSYPERVELAVGGAARKIHVLASTLTRAAATTPREAHEPREFPAAKAMLRYADGASEEIIWSDEEELGDGFVPGYVPGTRSVPQLLKKGQLCWFTIVPRRPVPIKTIAWESLDRNITATIVAMTAQLE